MHFSSFFVFYVFWIWLFWFSFGLNQISQVHDMTIIFLFSFFYFVRFFLFLILVVCLLRATMYAIDGPPDWSISSHVRIVLKGLAFGSRLLVLFLFRGKIWLTNILEKMGSFWSMCPEASIKVISERHDFGNCVFGHWKGLAVFTDIRAVFTFFEKYIHEWKHS